MEKIRLELLNIRWKIICQKQFVSHKTEQKTKFSVSEKNHIISLKTNDLNAFH
jgi:hypothetical protein